MKRQAPEHKFQVDVLDYLDAFGRPDLYWFAVGNGELRHPRVGARLKAEGVKPGIADICIMLEDGRAAWLELKSRRGRLSDAQIGFSARCARLGHPWACCKTMEEVFDILIDWGVLRSCIRREAVA